MALVGLAAACGRDEGPRRPLYEIPNQAVQLPADHPPLSGAPAINVAARMALNSGNAAFRSKDFARALRFYSEAARAAPAHASPWFGIFMVGEATGNARLRDSAQREVQKRTVDPLGVTDSTLRSTHRIKPKGTTS
jgi:hypothetical protein